jgi:hypothetical protein
MFQLQILWYFFLFPPVHLLFWLLKLATNQFLPTRRQQSLVLFETKIIRLNSSLLPGSEFH